MTAASKLGPHRSCRGGKFARRTRLLWGEAGVPGEEADMRSQGARRGRGPSAYARIAEIMSGRAIAQQGLVTTCKDRAHNGQTGGAGREMVWRMSPYERRRGVTPLQAAFEAAPARVTPVPGKGALGTRWPQLLGTLRTQPPGYAGPAVWRRGEANSTASGRRVRQHRSFARWGKARPEKCVQSRGQNRTRESRPSGIVEGLQETWPVGDDSTRRARLISISTPVR